MSERETEGDLQWIATELDDLALLLRVHHKEIEANTLDIIRKSLAPKERISIPASSQSAQCA
jgi:hypothetical protein